MKIRVSDLVPNPYRDLKRLPLDPEKVEALRQSIDDTGFWDNLLARKNDNGEYEAAYGWHRVAACKKSGVEEIDIPVRKLTNTEMAKIMAAENMAEWSHDAATEVETVRAVLNAYGAGEIELPPCGDRNRRYAGTGKSSPEERFPYTIDSLSKFLRWKPYKVQAALDVIGAVADDTLDDETVADLSTKQAQTVAQQVRRAAKAPGMTPAKAREIGKTLAAGMRKGSGGRYKASDKKAASITVHNAKEVTDNLMGRVRLAKKKKTKELPDVEAFASEQQNSLDETWFRGNRSWQQMEDLVRFRGHLSKNQRDRLIKSLRKLAERANAYADRLEAPVTNSTSKQLAVA